MKAQHALSRSLYTAQICMEYCGPGTNGRGRYVLRPVLPPADHTADELPHVGALPVRDPRALAAAAVSAVMAVVLLWAVIVLTPRAVASEPTPHPVMQRLITGDLPTSATTLDELLRPLGGGRNA